MKSNFGFGFSGRFEPEPDPGIQGVASGESCDSIWELLSVYADGETNPDETAMVDSHIAVCAECARDLEFMRSTTVVLSSVEEVEPPATLRTAILAATVDRKTGSQRFADALRRGLAPMPARYGYGALAGAAGLLLAFALTNGVTTLNHPALNSPSQPTITADEHQPEMKLGPAPDLSSKRSPNLVQIDPVTPDEATPNPTRTVRQEFRLAGDRLRLPHPEVLTAATGSSKPTNKPADRKIASTTTSGATRREADYKLKLPTGPVIADPDPADNGATVAMDTTPIMPEVKNAVEEMTPKVTEAVAAGGGGGHYTLIAASSPDVAGQATSLADLKRMLRSRNLEAARSIEQSIKAREIRLPVIKGSF